MQIRLEVCKHCGHYNVDFKKEVLECECFCHFLCSFCKNEVCYQDQLKKHGVVRIVTVVGGETCEAQVCRVCYNKAIEEHQPDIKCKEHNAWHPANRNCRYCDEEKKK